MVRKALFSNSCFANDFSVSTYFAVSEKFPIKMLVTGNWTDTYAPNILATSTTPELHHYSLFLRL